MRSMRHPADRTPRQSRSSFEELAERVSYLASSPVFFVFCFAIVLVWGLGTALGGSDRFVSVAGGAMSAVTLVLVTLLKNAEMRSERAIQLKLDAIASSLLEQTRGQQQRAEGDLRGAIGLHEEL